MDHGRDLDYLVWLIRGYGRRSWSTRFQRRGGAARGRKLTLNLVEARPGFGVAADDSRPPSLPIRITTMPVISIAFPRRGFICRTAR